MKEKINKTNVARLLDKAKIAYELVPYEVDENDLSATHVAEQLGENVEQVFKTLVLHGDKTGYLVCVIPGAESFGQQEMRVAPDERAAARHGLYPRRLLTHRNEKAFPHLHPPDGRHV